MSRQSPSHLRFSSATLLPTVFRRNGTFFGGIVVSLVGRVRFFKSSLAKFLGFFLPRGHELWWVNFFGNMQQNDPGQPNEKGNLFQMTDLLQEKIGFLVLFFIGWNHFWDEKNSCGPQLFFVDETHGIFTASNLAETGWNIAITGRFGPPFGTEKTRATLSSVWHRGLRGKPGNCAGGLEDDLCTRCQLVAGFFWGERCQCTKFCCPTWRWWLWWCLWCFHCLSFVVENWPKTVWK